MAAFVDIDEENGAEVWVWRCKAVLYFKHGMGRAAILGLHEVF